MVNDRITVRANTLVMRRTLIWRLLGERKPPQGQPRCSRDPREDRPRSLRRCKNLIRHPADCTAEKNHAEPSSPHRSYSTGGGVANHPPWSSFLWGHPSTDPIAKLSFARNIDSKSANEIQNDPSGWSAGCLPPELNEPQEF